MTNYQIKLTVEKYFNMLIDNNINEKDVKNFKQKNGYLEIILEDNTTIIEKINKYYE